MSSRLLAIVSFSAAFIVIAAFILWWRAHPRARSSTVLLLGPTDAGKTSIMSLLIYRLPLRTHASLQINTASLTLPNACVLTVTDVPGHPRLRGQFLEYLSGAKAVVFVVDASNVSRNGAYVAEHLHLVLEALVSLPPSAPVPPLLIVAHKCDTMKKINTPGTSDLQELAIVRVRAVLERELEKRRSAQRGAVGIENMGADGVTTEIDSLYCSPSGSRFRFTEWEGGKVDFLGTTLDGEETTETEDRVAASFEGLIRWLQCLP